jgi:L-ascorbate 6-phosphate lactonase
MAGAILLQPDLVIPVINGAYGNMDSHEAALLIRDSGAKNAIPCHFWTFMEHGGDPSSFRAECGKLCPTTRVTWLTPGKSFILLGACRPRDISKE